MWYCDECEEVFETPQQKEITLENYYGVEDLFYGGHTSSISVCPLCGNELITELIECDVCGELFNIADLYAEYINGNWGYCCSNCIENKNMIRGEK